MMPTLVVAASSEERLSGTLYEAPSLTTAYSAKQPLLRSLALEPCVIPAILSPALYPLVHLEPTSTTSPLKSQPTVEPGVAR